MGNNETEARGPSGQLTATPRLIESPATTGDTPHDSTRPALPLRGVEVSAPIRYTRDLLSHHAQMIVASGITLDVATARGYRSITDPADAIALGFADYQARVPALLVPVWGVDGRIATYQLRPDTPRRSEKGKPIKYETPAGSRMVIDVPPAVRPVIGDPSVPLLITEGVRKADSAVSHGGNCVALMGVWNWRGTNDQGGKVVLPDFESIALNGRNVYIAYDSDVMTNPNVKGALQRLTAFLRSREARVWPIYLPAMEGGKSGLDDFLGEGHTMEEVYALAREPEGAADALYREWPPGITSLSDVQPAPEVWVPQADPWPSPLADEAYHGVVGDIVRAIEPHTEADPAGLLLQTLIAAGNNVGRSPHFMAEEDRHGVNLFGALVGESSKARKGTSFGHVIRIFRTIDETWTNSRIMDGLSSGEGLIQQVRDAEPDADGKVQSGPDKRLLVQAPEFANVLAVQGRDGSTLSGHLRNAWDGRTLRTLTRAPLVATAPHISLIAHVTRDELLRLFDATDAANGYGNRFIWFAVRRSKLLPLGGRIGDVDFAPLIIRLGDALSHAPTVGELKRDAAADALWCEVYPYLSEARPGLLGAMLGRAEAIVMRVACIYALLDKSAVIRQVHLLAALAVWTYAEQSSRWIFGDRFGDPVADEILRALRASPDGLTRTEISGLFGRHKGGGQIGSALHSLEGRGLARSERVETEGRYIERWFAARRGA